MNDAVLCPLSLPHVDKETPRLHSSPLALNFMSVQVMVVWCVEWGQLPQLLAEIMYLKAEQLVAVWFQLNVRTSGLAFDKCKSLIGGERLPIVHNYFDVNYDSNNC